MPKDSKTIYHKVFELQAEIQQVDKTETAKVQTKSGQSYTYDYTSLLVVRTKIHATLQKLGLVLIQPIKDNKVYTIILDKDSGEQIESYIDISSFSGDTHAIGAAITYFRRYTLISLLGIVADSDPDGLVEAAQKKATPNMITTERLKNGMKKYSPFELEKMLEKYTLTPEQEALLDEYKSNYEKL